MGHAIIHLHTSQHIPEIDLISNPIPMIVY